MLNARRKATLLLIPLLLAVLAGCGDSPSPSAAGAGAPSAANDAAAPVPPASSSPSKKVAPKPAGNQQFTPANLPDGGPGRLMWTELTGKESGLTMKVWVWLPPQYDDPAYADKQFPVLEMFSGGDGVGYTQWFSYPKPEMVAEGAAKGTVSPFIVVEPQLQPAKKQDTECHDLAGQPKVGTFHGKDVPQMLQDNFRILPQRTAWGVGGASGGAYCAAKLLFTYPERFSVAVMLDGYFTLDTTLPTGKTPQAKAESPSTIANQGQDVKLRVWHSDNGNVGAAAAAEVAKVKAIAKPPTQIDVMVLKGGNHTWKAFEKMLPDLYDYFTRYLDKPA